MSDCQYIVEAAARIILQSFSADEVIDILAYTTRDNKICFSHNGFSQIETIIAKCKTAGNGESNIERYKKEVRDLFDDEIIASRNAITNYEKRYAEEVDKKSECEKRLFNFKNDDFQLVEALRNVLMDDLESFKIIFEDDDDSEFNYEGSLKNRESLLKLVKCDEDMYEYQLEKDRDTAREACATTLEDIKSEQAIIDSMRAYQDIFCDALDNAISTYRSKKRVVSVQNEIEATNIFEAIKKNDYTNFLHSFEDGVDMLLCNVDGYTPMTLAVKMGNAQMVKFMLDHNADPNLKDNRGYNAFHTAVENQYRNICELLLDEDPDLVDTETSKGESAEDIMEKNTFNKWLESQI